MRKTAVLSYIKCRAGEIFWFVVPPLIALIYYAVKGVFVYLGPDAQLYYSIAETSAQPATLSRRPGTPPSLLCRSAYR